MIFKRKENLDVILNDKVPTSLIGLNYGHINKIIEDNVFTTCEVWFSFNYGILGFNSIKLFDSNSVGTIDINFQ